MAYLYVIKDEQARSYLSYNMEQILSESSFVNK